MCKSRSQDIKPFRGGEREVGIPWGGGIPGGRGHSREVWVVVCCRGLQTLPLFILLSCLKLSNFF